MRGILMLAILTVKSRFDRGREVPVKGADDVPDTLQWWFGAGGCWRIQTYAVDHDIHIWKVPTSRNIGLEFAQENNQKHYGDILGAQHVIHFANCADRAEMGAEFGRLGLAPRVEICQEKFAFWKPDDAVYSTKMEALRKEMGPIRGTLRGFSIKS
jgi:hypothetical protein